MLTHFLLFAAAPGRHEEAEQTLCAWLDAVKDAPQWQGGAVLRGRPGEFGEIHLLAVTYQVASREEGLAFKSVTATTPNPMAEDRPDDASPDQGSVLFGATAAAASETAPSLVFDRGGALLARLMRIHFEPLADAPSSARAVTGADPAHT
jgi:hypothetical protein